MIPHGPGKISLSYFQISLPRCHPDPKTALAHEMHCPLTSSAFAMFADLLRPTSTLETASLHCQEHVCTIITESCRKLNELARSCLPAERALDIRRAEDRLQTHYNSLQEYYQLNWLGELRCISHHSFTEFLGRLLWLYSGNIFPSSKLVHPTNHLKTSTA